MKVYVIGIDGLDPLILNKHIDQLPAFKKMQEQGVLDKIQSIFPVDSVPAWQTIFTGLNPAEHGIIRGKDYVESIDDFNKNNSFKLAGKTFWDKVGNKKEKCLIVNPFLAYPAWEINGTMISGPAFVEGEVSKFPKDTNCNSSVYGGYKPMKNGKVYRDLENAYDDIVALWKDFENLSKQKDYNLHFVTFTQLDRIQHYSWRYYDENDPLYEKNEKLSNLIIKSLKFFDSKINELMESLDNNDKIIIVSDHGFGQRPYKLVNFNELFRQHGLLKLNNQGKHSNAKLKQKVKTSIINILSKLRILDVISNSAKKIPEVKKYKKSDFLIDKKNSLLYTDDLFCGKNPYCGFNFGDEIKKQSIEEKEEVINKLKTIFENNNDLPTYKWLKTSAELYNGKYNNRFPDVCMEMDVEYGVEFDFFTKIIVNSATHYKISGGHRNPGTFGFYSKDKSKPKINSIIEFSNLIISLFD